MPTKKKDKIILAVFALVIVGAIVGKTVGPMIGKKAEEKRRIEELYVQQNVAFDVCTDYTQNNSFHGADELKLNNVIVYVYAYNSYQDKYKLTLDEVERYFETEYDSSGNLKILFQPENIHDYIEWYYHGGNKLIEQFGDSFNEYMKKQGYDEHIYRRMEYKDVAANIDEYVNDPEFDLDTPN